MTPGLRILLGLGLAGAALAAAGWWITTRGEQTASGPVRLIVSGDTAGWIVPCGCTSNQSGGMPRRGMHVHTRRAEGHVIVADAGGAPGGSTEYHRIKFEAILHGELAMGLIAHNLGGSEAALGPGYLRRIASQLKVPCVSANLRDSTGSLVAEPIRIVRVAGRRYALAGVISRQYVQTGLRIDDARSAVLDAINAAKGRYDSLIVLAYMPEEELRSFAAGLPEADAVIGGPTVQAIVPTVIGPTLLAAATNKGKFLVDLSYDVGKWSGTIVELNQSFGDDLGQQTNVKRYLDELERCDIPANESGFAQASLHPSVRVAGNTACRDCHKDDCTIWDASKHSHAWDTLQAKGYHVDPACQLCHTTGYGLPDGFESVGRTPSLRAVGCESCHGPSLEHVKNVKIRTAHVARDECVRCHDRENSPTFAYEPFWEKIRHGRRPAAGGAP